jgi:hypothetical protein
MSKVQALFVDGRGIYPQRLGSENCWDEARDARTFTGDAPLILHPPCQLWTNMAAVNFKRYPKEKNRPGNDGGCFAFALNALLRCGGVLEHPAGSKAFAAHGIPSPVRGRWMCIGQAQIGRVWITEVSQCAYGHKARKRTWLIYAGEIAPFEVDWSEPPYTHQIGHDSKQKRPKPSLGKREACATPPDFAELLIHLASWCRA